MHYCFIGNSHLGQFHDSGSVRKLYKMGASIKGLVNPNSKLQLREDIQSVIQTSPNTTLVFFLGQVDIEFGYYYKCVIDQKKYDIQDYINDLIQKYESYLQTLKVPFVVLSINPTVIKENAHIYRVCFTEDNGKQGYYSETVKDMPYESEKVQMFLNDSFETRYSYNLLFNNALEEMCRKKSFQYVDFWPYICNDGVLKSQYAPKNTDHHLVCQDSGLFEYVMNKIQNIQ
jgi:hypothetical protein